LPIIPAPITPIDSITIFFPNEKLTIFSYFKPQAFD